MPRSPAILLALGLCCTHAQEAPPPSPTPSPTPEKPAQVAAPLSREQLLGTLSDAEIQQAIEAIRKSFLDPSTVNEEALRRAALEGLIARWEPGLELLQTTPPTPATPFPFLAEILDSHIAYLRPGRLDASVLPEFDATLKGFAADERVDALILDLRGIAHATDFEVGAELARRLSPKGKVLFSLQRPSAKQERIFTSNQDPLIQGLLVVLVDGRTSGAAETVAAALRESAGAMLVGSDTGGSAVEFEDVRLAGGAVLRVAVARVLLPGKEPLFPGGVKPDIAIAMPADLLDQIFRESGERGVSQFVFENERRRMNEASLVANTNPEIDTIQAQQRERDRSPTLRDLALQRAVDLVTAIQFYKSRGTRGTP